MVTNIDAEIGQDNEHVLTMPFIESNNYGLYIRNQHSPLEKIRSLYVAQSFDWDKGVRALLSYRQDGSSRLGSDNQWGSFYGVSVSADLSTLLNPISGKRLMFRGDSVLQVLFLLHMGYPMR